VQHPGQILPTVVADLVSLNRLADGLPEIAVTQLPVAHECRTCHAPVYPATERFRNRTPRHRRSGGPAARLFPPEMDEHPPKVLGVLFHPVVELFDVSPVEKPQDPLFELARPLAWNDLDKRRLLRHRFIDDATQRPVDVMAPVADVVQVEL